MNWTDERYVRLYTRDTRSWKRMGWQARCLLVMLMRKVDRSGVLELEAGWTDEDLAEEVGLPLDIVRSGLDGLVNVGTVTASHATVGAVTNGHERVTGVTIPNFLEAQDSRQSDASRQRASREYRRAKAIGTHEASTGVTAENRADVNEEAVTRGHTVSPDVTPAFLPNQPAVTNQPADPERARARETRSVDLDQSQSRSRNGTNGYAQPGSIDSGMSPRPWKAPARTGDEVEPNEAAALVGALAASLRGGKS